MSDKLRKVILSALLAGLAAVLSVPPAGARRGEPPTTTTTVGYVPPREYGQDPFPDGEVHNPHDDNLPGVTPTTVPVVLGEVVTDPGAGPSGGGETLGPTTDGTPTAVPVVLGEVITDPGADPSGGGSVGVSELVARHEVEDPSRGGVLSRTGSETMPLVRAGLAALALGGGLVVLGRRRRADVASA